MSDNQATAERFLTALEQRDTTSIADILAEDICQVLPFAATGGIEPAATFVGRAEVIRVQATIIDSFTIIEFVDPTYTVSSDGEVVFVEARGRRVHGETGRLYENLYLIKFEFDNGLIRRITEYSNPVAFARFFGRPVG